MNKNFDWKDFEETTKSVIDVICGDKVIFVCGGNNCTLKSRYGDNQFDVLYKWNSAIKTSYIAIECKYWNSLVDKDEIRNFNEKCEDCKIDTKIIVSKIGFTNRAILEASGKNIELIELRNFQAKDFIDCFKERILEINLDMIIYIPKIECSVNIEPLEVVKGATSSPDQNLIKLVYNDKKELLTDHIPFGKIDGRILKDLGFEIVDSIFEKTKNICTYRKKINCHAIEYEGRITKVKNVSIDVKEIVDKSNAITDNINLDIREEIKKAGYLVAKKIVERSNFVLDLENKNIIDQN